MIEPLIYKYLSADSELQALLRASGADTKMYPNTSSAGKPLPKIIYYASTPINQTLEPWLYEQTISFEIYAEGITQYLQIESRLYDLLNNFDAIQEAISAAPRLRIKECHAVSSFTMNTFPLENKNDVFNTLAFRVQFTRCKN